jgi:hypothetical protein
MSPMSTPGRSPDGSAELARVVVELERHAAAAGWDRPAQLFALVPTAELVAREPGLADQLGEGELTPVQQDELPGEQLEVLLQQIVWPTTVAGCAAVVERLVLPPGADEDIPDDPAQAAEFAAAHPDRQEVRIVAAADRDGAAWCALRLRAHDEDASVVTGADLVPGLLELLHATLEESDDD